MADLDGDGKPDLATANSNDGTVSLLRNLSTPGNLTTNSFAAHVDVAAAAGCVNLAYGDLDGDGKPDLAVACYNSGAVSILRNTSSPGGFTTASFAPHVDLPTLNEPRTVEIRDVDGDGKPDVSVGEFNVGEAVSVFRNLATPGIIATNSFAPRIDFAEGAWADGFDLGDLNGDGRPDFAVVGQEPSQRSFFANLSTPGNFTNNSLAPRVDLASGSNPNDIVIGDLNGDGRPDVVFCNQYGNTIYIYQNLTPFAGTTNPPPAPQIPVITAFAPVLGTNGTVVVLTGTNFSPVTSSNTVYFGAVRATVTLASTNRLTVIVPPGAIFAPITETVGGLTAYSPKSFLPTFAGNSLPITATNFGPVLSLPTGNGPFDVVLADLDGDGKPDLAYIDYYDSTLCVCRNTGTNGTNAFAAPVTFNLPSTSPLGLAVADIDGDGKLDIVVAQYDGNQVSVYRNLATPGGFTSNSLAAPVSFATGSGPQGLIVADLDGDGKPDLATANSNDGTVSLLRNLSTPGNLTTNSFAAHVDVAAAAGCVNLAYGDLDGDGKPDLAVACYNSGAVSILRNTSSRAASPPPPSPPMWICPR